MGQVLEEIGDKEATFIASQRIFFVATAPSSVSHHVNLSPKANNNHGYFVILDPHTVAYGDLTGSGAESAAHVRQNGRMTLMFANLEAGPPKILRLFGTAEVLFPTEAPVGLVRQFAPALTENPGFRAIYRIHVHRVSWSCGWSMPVMQFERYRPFLERWSSNAGPDKMADWLTLENSYSIDGLPSLGLWRKNAPAGIVPVLKDGNVFGKVAERTSLGSVLRYWMNCSARHVRMTLSHRVPFGHSILLAVLTLLIGVYLGQTLPLPDILHKLHSTNVLSVVSADGSDNMQYAVSEDAGEL